MIASDFYYERSDEYLNTFKDTFKQYVQKYCS